MNSFKDFKNVMKKHNAISSAYKKVWKYSVISSVTAGILVTSYLLYPSLEVSEKEFHNSTSSRPVKNKAKQQIQNQNILFTPLNTKVNLNEKQAIKATKETVTSVSMEKEIVLSNSDDEIEEDISYKQLKPLKSPSKSGFTSRRENNNTNAWYTLNEKPREEIIKLPTLLVSNKAWPKNINKAKLITSPSITTVYQSINQEIPIVNGMAYITSSTSKDKPQGHKLNGNYFPPSLIRDIHKTSKSCILLLKDIELIIPGRGRVNIGDREIKINIDNHRNN
jgi:hypothetical protein